MRAVIVPSVTVGYILLHTSSKTTCSWETMKTFSTLQSTTRREGTFCANCSTRQTSLWRRTQEPQRPDPVNNICIIIGKSIALKIAIQSYLYWSPCYIILRNVLQNGSCPLLVGTILFDPMGILDSWIS
jgi:hypothetical protein